MGGEGQCKQVRQGGRKGKPFGWDQWGQYVVSLVEVSTSGQDHFHDCDYRLQNMCKEGEVGRGGGGGGGWRALFPYCAIVPKVDGNRNETFSIAVIGFSWRYLHDCGGPQLWEPHL